MEKGERGVPRPHTRVDQWTTCLTQKACDPRILKSNNQDPQSEIIRA